MRKHLPEIHSILQVYSVIAVMLTGWTIIAFLWKLSAWLLLLNLGEIFTIFSYAMTVNFIESLFVLLILLTASALLPAHTLRDDFVVRGSVLAVGFIGSLISFVGSEMQFGIDGGLFLLTAPLVVLAFMTILLQRSSTSLRLRSTAEFLSDRVVVFLFILAPVFAIASTYIIIRNIA